MSNSEIEVYQPIQELVAPPKIALNSSSQYLMTLRSKNSRKTMKSLLNNIAAIFGAKNHTQFEWLAMTASDVNLVIENLTEIKGLKPTTVNLYINALKGVFKAAHRHGNLTREELEKICDIKTLKASRLVKHDVPPIEVIKQLLGTCDDSACGTRDAAIISLMANCGLRRDEVVNLSVSQYDGKGLNVIGKGDKERRMPMNPGAKTRLDAWLRIRGMQEGFIFCRIRRWGIICTDQEKPLSGQFIYKMVIERSKLVSNMSIKPHALRRFCGTTLLKSGRDIVLVRDFLGHSDIKTTQIYIENNEEEMAEAANSIDIE